MVKQSLQQTKARIIPGLSFLLPAVVLFLFIPLDSKPALFEESTARKTALKYSIFLMYLLLPSVAPILGRAQSQSNEIATFETADFTRPSPGKFVSGWNAGTNIVQASRAGMGQSLEYRRSFRGNNSVGLLYTRTPTDSKLILPQNSYDIWPISRNEFDLLYTRRLKPFSRRWLSPYGTAGAGAILLDGKKASGLDRQFAYVVGGGGDFRMPHRIRLRVGVTTDVLKASTYSDVTYRSSWTVMAEPRIGFVVPLGWPARY